MLLRPDHHAQSVQCVNAVYDVQCVNAVMTIAPKKCTMLMLLQPSHPSVQSVNAIMTTAPKVYNAQWVNAEYDLGHCTQSVQCVNAVMTIATQCSMHKCMLQQLHPKCNMH